MKIFFILLFSSILIFLFSIPLIALGFFAYRLYRYQWEKDLEKKLAPLADSSGLKLNKTSIFRGPSLTGTKDGIDVKIDGEVKRSGKFVSLQTSYRLNISGYISVYKESSYSKAIKKVGLDDIHTGDEEFDEIMFCAASDSYYIPAFMNQKNRENIKELARLADSLNITVSGVTSRWNIPQVIGGDVSFDPVKQCLTLIVDMSKGLSNEQSIKERLIENIRTDSYEAVRLENIRALAVHYPIDKDNISLFEECLGDASLRVQVEAAKHLGERGISHLLSLLKKGIALGDTVLAEALSAINKTETTVDIGLLGELFTSAKTSHLKKEVITTVTRIGGEDAGAFLVKHLNDGSSEVQQSIIAALGTCGTITAVEPLFLFGKDSLNPFVRSATKKAILQIQSRIGEVESGWLSMSELDKLDGALSKPGEASPGALSIEEEAD